MAPDTRTHIYGILDLDRGARLERIVLGDCDGEVRAVGYRDVAAAVGRAPLADYGALDKPTLLRCLIAHQRVLEQLLPRHTVLPVKFGTVAADDQELLRILEMGYAELRRALEASRGKVEFEVVATWQVEPVLAEIAAEPAIREMKAAVELMPSEARIKGHIEVGRAVKQRLDERKVRLQGELEAELRARGAGCAHRLRMRETMDDTMVLNMAALVFTERQAAFEEALRALADAHAHDVNFRCIGPLPPYSFMTVEIQRPDCDAIAGARMALGLGEEASLRQVKETYTRAAAAWHPDRRPGDLIAANRFREIAAAWETLAAYCDTAAALDNSYSFRREDVEKFVRVSVVEPGADLVQSRSIAVG